MKRLTVLLMLLTCACPAASAAENRTDLRKENYVEFSATDFVLTIRSTSETGKVKTFELAAANPGDFTLLCFINGKFWARTPIKLPGNYRLNTSGLVSANYRITLQAVDGAGRIGSARQTISVAK